MDAAGRMDCRGRDGMDGYSDNTGKLQQTILNPATDACLVVQKKISPEFVLV